MERMLKIFVALLGVNMMAIGLFKIARWPVMAENMAQIHFGGWALQAQGSIEVAAGVVTLVPKTRNLGLCWMMAILIGAVGAHLGAGQELGKAAPAIVVLVLTAAVFVARNRAKLGELLLGG